MASVSCSACGPFRRTTYHSVRMIFAADEGNLSFFFLNFSSTKKDRDTCFAPRVVRAAVAGGSSGTGGIQS